MLYYSQIYINVFKFFLSLFSVLKLERQNLSGFWRCCFLSRKWNWQCFTKQTKYLIWWRNHADAPEENGLQRNQLNICVSKKKLPLKKSHCLIDQGICWCDPQFKMYFKNFWLTCWFDNMKVTTFNIQGWGRWSWKWKEKSLEKFKNRAVSGHTSCFLFFENLHFLVTCLYFCFKPNWKVAQLYPVAKVCFV